MGIRCGYALELGVPGFGTSYTGLWDVGNGLFGLDIMGYRASILGTLAFTTWHSGPWDLLGHGPLGFATPAFGTWDNGVPGFGTWDNEGTGLWNLTHRNLGLETLAFGTWYNGVWASLAAVFASSIPRIFL